MASDAKSWRSALGQVKSASGVLVQGLAQGMAIGWSSPGMAKLMSGQGPFVPTLPEATWIVSLFDLGCGLGVLAGAAVFARAGRRLTLLVGPVSFTVWCLLTYFATAPGFLMAARLLAGAGQGMCMSFSYIYVGEVTTPRLRGKLILTVALVLPMGQLLIYMAGPAMSFWAQALAPLPFIACSALLMLTLMEESPFYLAMRGRREQLLAVLARLRGSDPRDPNESVRMEAASILKGVEQQQEDAATWREMFRPPGAKRAACIVLVESGSLAAVGVTTVLAFTQQIFEEAGTPMRPDLSASVLIAIKVAMVLVSMVLIERLGRRLQLGLGALINCVAMMGLAGFFLARDRLGADVSGALWVPLASLMVFIASAGAGVNAVPQVLMSELLSQRAKAVVAPVAIVIVSITSFGLNKAFMLVGKEHGFDLPFGLYAITNLLVAVFTFIMVPETKGKTLVQVQEMLRGRHPRRVHSLALEHVRSPGPGEHDPKGSTELTFVFAGAKKSSA